MLPHVTENVIHTRIFQLPFAIYKILYITFCLSVITNLLDLDYLLVVFCVFLLRMSRQVVVPEVHLLQSAH